MINKVFTGTLMFFITVTFTVTTFAYSENIVASLDNEKVTVESLATYVKDVAGKTYEPWLRNAEGLRKLADFFINRTLLLEHAKKTVDKKNTIVKNHSVRSVDADVMLLTSLLQTEVQDKVQITQEDVSNYMKKNVNVSEKLARQKLESDLKTKLMDALVEKVRMGHSIKYF